MAELKQEKTGILNDDEKIKLETEKAKLEAETSKAKAETEKLKLEVKNLKVEKSLKNETNTTKTEIEKQTISPQQSQIISQQIQQTPSLQGSVQLIGKISIFINSQNIGETTAQIEWTTSESTESKLYLSGGGINSQQYPSKNGYTTRHIVVIENLKSMTNYSFQITASGNNGFADYTGGFKTRTLSPTLQITPEDGSKFSLEGIGHKLTWKSTYTTQCAASGNWDGDKNTSGEYPLSFSQAGTYTYILTCAGINGENISKSINLKIIKSTPEIYLLINGQRVNSYTAKVGEELKFGFDIYSEVGGTVKCRFKIGNTSLGSLIDIYIGSIKLSPYDQISWNGSPISFNNPYVFTSVAVTTYSADCIDTYSGIITEFLIPIAVIE